MIELEGPRCLLYVRPDYSNYRTIGLRLFSAEPDFTVDFDHALAKNLALGSHFKYVLMLRVARHVNRGHGFFEKGAIEVSPTQGVAYVDLRIFDKWVGRPPKLMPGRNLKPGYTSEQSDVPSGTLAQRGRLSFALGWSEVMLLKPKLIPFVPRD